MRRRVVRIGMEFSRHRKTLMLASGAQDGRQTGVGALGLMP